MSPAARILVEISRLLLEIPVQNILPQIDLQQYHQYLYAINYNSTAPYSLA